MSGLMLCSLCGCRRDSGWAALRCPAALSGHHDFCATTAAQRDAEGRDPKPLLPGGTP